MELEGSEEVENSFSLHLSFSTWNVWLRSLSKIRKAVAKISSQDITCTTAAHTPPASAQRRLPVYSHSAVLYGTANIAL